MKQKFNYLQHDEAVNEMLKHKWIESQKSGRDIGFATAALDWIKRFGQSWKRANNINDNLVYDELQELMERRKYRRFKINLPIKIKSDNLELDAQIKEFNHVGLDFISDTSLDVESYVEITTLPSNDDCSFSNMRLRAKVIKSSFYQKSQSQNKKYLIFTLFDRDTQQKIINKKNSFLN